MRDSPNLRRLTMIGLGCAVVGVALIAKNLRRTANPAEPPAGVSMPAATRVDDTRSLPDFRLDGPAGPVTLEQLKGRWTMLFFGYTQCPDVCPTTLSMLAAVFEGLQASEYPQVLFVSVDPARDTPELLSRYVPAFNPAFAGATGSEQALAPLIRHLGIVAERHPAGAAGQYTIDHTASVFLIDPETRLKAVFSPPHDTAAVLADYRKLTR